MHFDRLSEELRVGGEFPVKYEPIQKKLDIEINRPIIDQKKENKKD